MENYIYLVLKKEKKPISFDKLCLKVQNLIRKEDESYILTDKNIDDIKKFLINGIKNYKYYETPSGNYVLMSKTSFRKGKFYADKNGNGKVKTISSYIDKNGDKQVVEEQYIVANGSANGAIDGDIVLVDTGGKNGEPKVDKIINRHLESVVGEVYRIGSSYFLKPLDKKKQDLQIALSGEAIEGQRVSVNLIEQTADNFYIGEVTRVFNHKDDPDEDILWEAFKYGIDDEFSKDSWNQVKNIPTKVRDSDRIGREDLTNLEIFTIDGADTKDMDDALSCEILPNGNYLVGVHIADVSHYVPEDSPLDLDARRKGTSNYLGGKVIPMLPHELSNGICSLNPYVERCALSCIMEVTPEGKVVKSRITPSIINSSLKMTYDKVNDILKYNIIDPQYEEHVDTLRNLNKLALVLRKKRIKNGAIEFNRPELKVVLDENGKVSGFSKREQDLGENLIEEFMLLANETVDKFAVDNGFPCLHRIHDKPNAEKLNDYLFFLSAINYPFKVGMMGENITEDKKLMQELVEHANKADKLSMLLTVELIKCNSRAKYSPHNIGHYGLAKENYCHFTSPIRRYPDLTVHRIVKDILNGDKEKINKWKEKLPDIGAWSSKMEKNADDAENAVLRMRCAEYMSNHIGDEYECTITGISDRGISVELDNMIEGFVRIKDLKGSYVYSPESYSLVSLDGFENYFVGDRLKVNVLAASKEEKKINFGVVEKIKENKIANSTEINRDVKIKSKIAKTRGTYFKK